MVEATYAPATVCSGELAFIAPEPDSPTSDTEIIVAWHGECLLVQLKKASASRLLGKQYFYYLWT